MTLERKYTPQIGKRVKLASFSDYTAHGIHVWSWLTVRAIDGDLVTVEHYNAGDTGEFYTLPLSLIAKPLGWQQQYTIYVEPEKAADVLAWLDRGIVVRASHALENAGRMAFQPMDNSQSPHWQYTDVTDVIPASETRKVFRIVAVEIQEINFVHSPACGLCSGSGRDTAARIQKVWNEIGRNDNAWDAITSGQIHVENYDAADGTFTCNCRYGGFRTLGRSKRAKLIKQWESEGWTVEDIKHAGGIWQRSRETVVSDYQKDGE